MDGDSRRHNDLIWFYRNRFCWDEFVDTFADVIPEYAIMPDSLPEEASEEAQEAYVENEADYTYESEELLLRMGIRDLDGRKGFVWGRPAGWLDVVMRYTDRNGEDVFERYPLFVDARIIIAPEGWDGKTGDIL